MTFDWSFDSVYLQYSGEGWITIELTNPDYSILDNKEKIKIFQLLITETHNKLKSYHYNGVPDALIKLTAIREHYNE